MARVILSSGHTSDNPGVVAYGLREYDLARKIAKFALKYIRQAGIISLSTPPNLDLAQRIGWINNTGYNAGSNDIAIEIHINDGGKRGIEGWFAQDGNNPSAKLTNLIVDNICQDLSLPSQGVKSEFQHQMGSISFIHEVTAIGCVVECCYIDNADDAMILGNDNSLEKIGRSIAKGVIKYFGLNIELPEVAQASAMSAQPQQIQQNAFNQPTSGYNQPIENPQPTQQQYSQPARSYQPTTYPQSSVMSQPYTAQPSAVPQPYMAPQPYGASITADQQLQQYQNYQAPIQPTNTPTYQAPAYQVPSESVGPSGPVGSAGSVGQAGKTGFLPREERKQMIIDTYAKVLGRDPNDNDLNYFLNTGIREDELVKKMVDSQEHSDLVKARQDVITSKQKMNEEQNELLTLRTKSLESDTIIKGLNGSIEQKNKAITELYQRIKELEQQKDPPTGTQKKSTTYSQKKKYRGNLSDRVFKAFSDILE